jgi:O-antigen ligase
LIGLFVLQLALLLMTRTKGNWGGFLVGAMTLIVLQSKNPLRAIVRLGGFALIGGAVIFLLLTFTSGNTLTVLNDAIFAITHPLEAPTFIYRMGLWQDHMIPALLKQPFIGYGTSSAGEGLLNLYEGTGSLYFNSHNLYLKVLLELGLFGLILFLWIIGESLWKGLRQLRGPANKNLDSSLLLQWSIACVIAFLVSGIVIPTLDAYPVNYYFWLLLGLLSIADTLSVQT